MAISATQAAGNMALELGGKPAGPVSSLQLPGYELRQAAQALGPGGETQVRGANAAITPMQAQFSLSESGPLLDWALSLTRGVMAEQDGAALMADHNGRVKRRVDWRGGLLTELRLPVLDARESKRPFAIGLTWQPESVSYAVGGSTKLTLSARKSILSSNFRVLGLPFDGSDIVRVGLPLVRAVLAEDRRGMQRFPTRHYAMVDRGPVTVQGSARSRDLALAYVQKVIRDGAVTDEEYFDLTVEMLDPSLKKVLATISLTGCGLMRYEEDPMESVTDKVAGYSLTFSVSQIDLKLTPAK